MAHGVEPHGLVGDVVLRRAAEFLPCIEPGRGEEKHEFIGIGEGTHVASVEFT